MNPQVFVKCNHWQLLVLLPTKELLKRNVSWLVKEPSGPLQQKFNRWSQEALLIFVIYHSPKRVCMGVNHTRPDQWIIFLKACHLCSNQTFVMLLMLLCWRLSWGRRYVMLIKLCVLWFSSNYFTLLFPPSLLTHFMAHLLTSSRTHRPAPMTLWPYTPTSPTR
mgnify:CR=1 FL=1